MANRAPTLDPLVFTIADLKVQASKKLDVMVRDYFNEGAMDLLTMRDNEDAFNRYKIRARVLINVEEIDTSSKIFGSKVSFPFGFSPAAMHGLAHPLGEVGTSRAASKKGIAMGLSSYSNSTLEDVMIGGREEGGAIPYGFQMCVYKDRSLTEALLKRAENAGFKAVIVSVDCPYLGRRINEFKNDFALPKGTRWGNLFPPGVEVDMTNMGEALAYGECPNILWPSAPALPLITCADATLDWSIIPWMRERTSMQVWLKGISAPEDVALAITHKADGVIISNHGGRQLDGAPSSLDSLRECAPIAAGKIAIGVDGGIRRGSDIFKALAMGADFALAGRIPIWGLAYKGQEGVELAIDLLREEFKTTMALAGCRRVEEISRKHLVVLNGDGRLSKL